MTDRLSKTARSKVMSRIRKRDTTPELKVRRALHSLGYRFRLYRADLPGTPDIILPKYNAVVLVHGCFWHQHQSKRCTLSRHPKSRLSYWTPKLARNRQRDVANARRLRRAGWSVLTVWECEVGNDVSLQSKLRAFLGSTGLAMRS